MYWNSTEKPVMFRHHIIGKTTTSVKFYFGGRKESVNYVETSYFNKKTKENESRR